MRGSAPFRLHEDLGIGQDPFGFGRHRIGAEPDHDRGLGAARFAHGIEHVGEKRLAGDRVQHFRPRRTHASAFASRQHNGKASTFSRQWTSSAARLGRRRRHIRVRRGGKGGMREQAPSPKQPISRKLAVSILRRFAWAAGAGGSTPGPVSAACAPSVRGA